MTRDFTQAGHIRMTYIAATGATTALVTLEQARDLYTELQQLVRWDAPAEHNEDGSFRAPEHSRWHSITIRPLSNTQIAAHAEQLERIGPLSEPFPLACEHHFAPINKNRTAHVGPCQCVHCGHVTHNVIPSLP